MPYRSGEPTFTRERYILVAAIVTVTNAGFWNICVVERRKKSMTLPLRFPLVANENVQGREVLVVLFSNV